MRHLTARELTMKKRNCGVTWLSRARGWLCLYQHLVGSQWFCRMNIAEAWATVSEVKDPKRVFFQPISL